MPYREAIALQPAALDACLQSSARPSRSIDVAPLKSGPVVLTGIGASLYAAVVTAAQMRSQGIQAFALPGTDLSDASVDAGSAYIAFSASGRSEEPAHAMELRPAAATYGIAKADATPLSRVVKHMIATDSGADSGPNTTSYLGSLLTAALLADKVCTPSGAQWPELSARAAATLDQTRKQADKAAKLLSGKKSIDCVGAGCAYGTAGYAALLIREAARIAAQDWDTLNFLHGPMEPNDKDSGVLLFGDGREVKLAKDLAAFGIPSVLVTSRTNVDDEANLCRHPCAGLLERDWRRHSAGHPAQLLIATLSEDAGLPVCNFRYRQTDTKRDV